MTPDTTSLDYQISVMQAKNSDHTIRVVRRPRGCTITWEHFDFDGFNWIDWEYRIAEEPREPRRRWANFYSTDLAQWEHMHKTKQAADICAGDFRIGEAVEFVEVL